MEGVPVGWVPGITGMRAILGCGAERALWVAAPQIYPTGIQLSVWLTHLETGRVSSEALLNEVAFELDLDGYIVELRSGGKLLQEESPGVAFMHWRRRATSTSAEWYLWVEPLPVAAFRLSLLPDGLPGMQPQDTLFISGAQAAEGAASAVQVVGHAPDLGMRFLP